jgi:hypothetical protein
VWREDANDIIRMERSDGWIHKLTNAKIEREREREMQEEEEDKRAHRCTQ